MPHHSSDAAPPANRRDFLRSSTVAAIGGAMAGTLSLERSAHAAGSDVLKLGLVGCGGRGTGAVVNALGADKNVKLTALADTFADHLQSSLSSLKQSHPDKMAVGDEQCFVGFDAYQKLLACDVDVVILATPPHFRPAHLKAAIAAGKHVFCEKPVAVDAPGVRSVLASAEEAKSKNLSIVSGLCYRFDVSKRETVKRIHDGAIGDVQALHASYNAGPLKYFERVASWSEMEFQLRNWNYFNWLSGDFNVEQHVHSLDKAAWVMNDEPPVTASGLGGRQCRAEEGNVYDHFAVVYEYANGTKLFSYCRQIPGCTDDVSDHVIGTKGRAELMRAMIKSPGQASWRYRGPKPSMYDVEHQELFAGIRSGSPVNNGVFMARSTMIAIMGRMAAYTGKTLEWKQCLKSKEDWTPTKYEWGPVAVRPVAKPGITRFV